MKDEAKILHQIESYLDGLINAGNKIFYARRNADGVNFKIGEADMFAVVNGRHIEIECKDAKGRPSAPQIKFQYKCERLGIPYCRPTSLEEFQEFLAKYL